ncbi:DMT family transporter [Paenibacillus polymyxa]|uniref:DMT family transporter n=1 Tax=Paenibacillus TaxID=44249 RepID=UPI0021E4819C|nr:DMT family transporter [Paenibacillus polymyxa]
MWFAYAVGAAFFFGLRGILYQWTSQRTINRDLMFIGVYISSAILVLIINLFVNQIWSNEVWFGVLMGVFSFLANTFLYKGYAVGRASVIAFFSGLTPVIVVLLAALLWAEKLSSVQLVGFCIIILSLLIIRYKRDLQEGTYQGWQFGLLAIIFYSFTDLSSKQALLNGVSILPLLTLMFATSSILFSGAFLINFSGQRPSSIQVGINKQREIVNRWTLSKTLCLGIGVGLVNVLAMVLKLAAFNNGVTGVVSAIIALSVVVVLLYARFYLKESMSRTEMCGVIIAIIGIIVVKWM